MDHGVSEVELMELSVLTSSRQLIVIAWGCVNQDGPSAEVAIIQVEDVSTVTQAMRACASAGRATSP